MQNITFVGLAVVLLVTAPLTNATGSPREATASDDGLENHVLTPDDHKKIMVGEVEDVLLLPWTISLPARIDTGATLSALDARNLVIQNNVAEFTLGKKYGEFRLHLPIVGWRQVRTAVGTEKRPVVKVGICLGPKLIRTLATLSDRSQMIYPFLVGRNVLNGSFMVDTSRSKTVQPACLSDLSRSNLN
jgi:hypothetical protein